MRSVPTWKKVEAVTRLNDLANYILNPDEGDGECGFTAELETEFHEKLALLREGGWTNAADELAARLENR
jgi:hypothetical protein